MNYKEDNKRITFLIGSMGRGGAERVISVLANSYARKGWKVDILLLLDGKVDYVLDSNVNIVKIYNENISRIMQLPKWIINIRKYVRENNPDRIVSFIARINIITIISCIGLKKNIIVSERNDPINDGRSMLVKILTNLLYPLINYVVFQTKFAQDCFSERVKKKSVIIANPITVSVKTTQNKEKKIVAVGRLIEQKNHMLLINAFKNVYSKYPEYKLYIYGEGRLRTDLEQHIKNINMQENILLPGNIINIHERIANAEIFVLSSNYEGLSNALLEAMTIGLPCISTNCSGVDEIIKNEFNGLLVPKGNEELLTQAIISLIEDSELRERISSNAFEFSKQFDNKIIFEKWKEIING